MDSAITFATAVAGSLGLVLMGDLVVAAVRSRAAIRHRLDHPIRLVVGSTLCASLLVGSLRPVLAVTPPPAMRIVTDVDAPSEPVPKAAQPGLEHHTVERGDSLWRIARMTLVSQGLPSTGADVAAYWPRIHEANREIIGSDPHLIHPGQVLELPDVGSHEGAPHGA